jgi:F-type H+-transporting ATPase subunit b
MKLNKVWLLVAVLAMTLFVTSVSWAQEAHGAAVEGGGHEQPSLVKPDIPTAIFTIVVFVVLLIVLRATAWKPILTGLKSREQAIREGLEAAARAKAEAERTAKELDAKIADVQRQGAQALAQARADAAKLAETIRAQAESEAAALKERTLTEIDAAKQQALSEINRRAADLGTAVARKILQREIRADDHQKLVEDSLAELAAAKN